MEKITRCIVQWLLKKDFIKSETYEWCIYGVQKRLTTLLTWILLLLISGHFWGVSQSVWFTIGFLLLRRRTNGYHFKTYFTCLFFSIVLEFFSMWIINNLESYILFGVLIISDVLILILSPVNNDQIHLTASEIFGMRTKVFHLIITITVICTILIWANSLSTMLRGVIAGLLADVITLIAFYLKTFLERIHI